jgi:hypothetical protein
MKPCPVTKLEVIDSNEYRSSSEVEILLDKWFADCGLKDEGNFWMLFELGTLDPNYSMINASKYPLTPDEAMVIVLEAESAEAGA